MKQKTISLSLSLLIFLAIISWSCSKSGSSSAGGSTPPPTGSANAVSITGMTFSPSTTTVKAGTKVTWTNNDPIAHTVTSDDGTSFNSGSIASGGTFSFIASTAGTFGYHCTIHSGMTASLTVTQ